MSKVKLKVLISDTYDPWFNIATEDFIFRDMISSSEIEETKILYLWRNDQTVVIGRFQNPWTECNTKKMEEDGIKLARRQSGGGAVYHDLGNTNFTLLSGKKSFDKLANNSIIIKSVNAFGLNSFQSGRNDLLVTTSDGDKKFSGSAFKETKDRSFHHGTLLINADLNKLATYLNPSKKKLETKGISSVRSRVINLQSLNSQITHERLQLEIINQFFDYYQTECKVELLDLDYLLSQPKLTEHYHKMRDWHWRYGESPEFNHQMRERFSWGEVDVRIEVEKGIVTQAIIFSDTLHPEMIESLTNSLKNVHYNTESISVTLNNLKLELPMIEEYLEEFRQWMLCQIK